MGCVIGHRIDCNGVGALRGHTYPAKINTSNPPGCQYRSKTIMKMYPVAFVFFALTGLLFSPRKCLRVLFWDILHQCKVRCLKTVRKENNLAKSLRVVSFEMTGCSLARDEKLDLLHFWQESKVKSNMVLALTSPLTRVKDVAKYISSLLTPLTSVKVKSNW